MPNLQLADYLARALHLLALSLAPRWLSPDPGPVGSLRVGLAAVVLVTLSLGALRFRKAFGGKLGSATAVAIVATWAAAIGAAVIFQGEAGPLGRALPYIAPLWWGTLALAAATAARGLLLKRVRVQAAVVAAGLVLAVGSMQLWRARGLLGSPEQMWARAAELEPGHERAQLQVAARLAPRRQHAELLSRANRCLSAKADSCSCLAIRASALLRLQRREEGLAQGRAAAQDCQDHPLVRASHGHALALAGLPHEALAETQRASRLLEGWAGPSSAFEAELHYAQALALEGTGQGTAALAEARRAVDSGGGRDARLLAAAIAIGAGELAVAARQIEAILAVDPDDPDALYDRALIADRRGDYNRAREGYLATLRAAPAYAAARYNLAVLTWRQGVRPEARHHVKLFLRDYPRDPRAAALQALIAEAADPDSEGARRAPRGE